MKHYYVSYLFKPNNNELGQWGWGSVAYKCTGKFNPYEAREELNKKNNFECTIINWQPITREMFNWKGTNKSQNNEFGN